VVAGTLYPAVVAVNPGPFLLGPENRRYISRNTKGFAEVAESVTDWLGVVRGGRVLNTTGVTAEPLKSRSAGIALSTMRATTTAPGLAESAIASI
jgi:hypothetical protein